MKIGIWLQPTVDVPTVTRRVVRAEELGLDFVGITDGQMIWRDVYVCLTHAASATSRIHMGPWVTNAVTRHPTATANAICTLDELSGGRAFVGIGVGDDSVHTIGREPAPVAELADVVETMRALMTGQDVSVDSDHNWSLSTGHQPAPPVYWAAAAPRSLRTGGRTADGVIHSGWLLPELADEDLGHVDAGIRESGRDETDVAKIFNSAIALDDDRDVALEWAMPYAARAFIYRSSTRVPSWNEERRQELKERYDYYGHFRSTQGANVPLELVTAKVVAGTPDDAVELLTRVIEAGYTHLALTPMGDVDAILERFARDVLPNLAVKR